MMSNSNYSIGLQRLKPVHTACTIWPKIGLGHETKMAETETRRWYVSRMRRPDRDHNPGLYRITSA